MQYAVSYDIIFDFLFKAFFYDYPHVTTLC